MKGLVNQAGGLRNFFGDGSDGAFNPATILANATAPNGGTVANLWDMNSGTSFTTGSLSSAGDQVIFSIDFGFVTRANSSWSTVWLWQFSTSVISQTIKVQHSIDGVTWTTAAATVSSNTTPENNSINIGDASFRYLRLIKAAGGSTCTFSCQGVTLNYTTGDTQTTAVWRVLYQSALNGPAVVKQFSSLTLPAGYSMTVENPCQGLIIYCQGNAVINGTIDMSKKAGLAPNGNIIPMPITKKAKKTAKTSSLLHFNNNVTDDNGRVWTANGTPTYDTTNKKFGTAAISFNGSSQWVDTSVSDDFSFGADDFTIDFWMRPTTVGANAAIFGQRDSTNTTRGLEITLNSSAKIGAYYAGVYALVSATTIAANTWYHVSVVRYGGRDSLYLNGVLEASTPSPGALPACTVKPTIGRIGEYSGQYFTGQIDEFRVIKGKAMWTANFTPPTAEYTYTATYTDEPKTLEKYLQLTSVLQALRGGYGGNGGYGGGGSGSSYRQISVGIGGAGRINQGGFGGGGSGGGTGDCYGGIGGSILNAELGGGKTKINGALGSGNNFSLDGVNGSGASGAKGTGTFGRCLGGGTGGQMALYGGTVSDSEYSGGFLCLIAGGNVSGTGAMKADGGAGSAAAGAGGYGGGGGGGGSGGGVIMQLYAGTDTFSGTRSVNGGAGGSGGAGANGGEAGGAGSSGGLGTIHLQQVA